MTDQEKALVRKDLALCLKLNIKLGDYRNLNAVQKIYDWIGKEPRFHTVIGKRYVKRLEEVLEGETDFADCVLCNGFMMEGTAVCPDCLRKYRSLISQSAEQEVQMENGTVQKTTAFSRQTANTAKQMSAAAKDSFHTVTAKIGEFTGENETLSVAKDKLKGIADSGMEKLQTNPEAAKAMEKGQEQVRKENIKKTGAGSKNNIWKIILILILIPAVFKACGNGNTCKEKGCHDEIYKDGYCRIHYTLHITNEYMDGYFNPDYGK